MDKREKIQKIRELIDGLKELTDGLSGGIGEPLTTEEIQEIEEKLKVKLPEEYKEFLQTFGSLSVVGLQMIDGHSVIKETRKLREYYPKTFSYNLIPIEEDGYGNYYCVVCDGKDRGKIIFWQHDVYPDQVYPNYPPDKDSDFWIESPDFWTWLLERLQLIKKEEKEEKQKEEGLLS